MDKPNLRIIHHMARTGGTLISKCLACMEDVVLLGEVHPLHASLYNPVSMAAQWFGLFDDRELRELSSNPLSFLKAVQLINGKVEQQGKKLVLRDWSHLDYIAVPFLPQAGCRPLLYETLAQDFNVIRVATVRHPIPQWISLNRLAVISGKVTIEQYLHGYLKFAEVARETGFVRYEDFTLFPDESLQKMTSSLQLQYDPEYKTKWMYYRNVTGDSDQWRQEIRPWQKPSVEASLLRLFWQNRNYRASLDILGYEHYEN